MSHLIARLAARSRTRLAGVWLALAVMASICCVFAWMAPSLVTARTSGLARLPQAERLDVRPLAGADANCSDAYDFIYVTGPSGSTAHPLTLASGKVASQLGLQGANSDASVVVDALTGVEAGVQTGDTATIVFPDRNVSSIVRVMPAPARIDEGTTGSIWLDRSSTGIGDAFTAYGPPDRAICLGSAAGTPVSVLLSAAIDASAHDGLSSSGEVFANLVEMAWLAVTLLTLAVTLHRRRQHLDLLRALGVSRPTAIIAGFADALAIGVLGAAVGAGVAYWLRTNVLHLWTDPAAIAPTLLIFVAGLWLTATLAGLTRWRSLQ
jgi:hypothetical protein